MIRRIAFAALIVVSAAPVGAQISRGRQGGFAAGPDYWVGLSYGYMDGLTLADSHTNSVWEFRYSSQLRATLEKNIARGVSAGVSAGFANPKLSYIGRTVGDPCGPGCQADAQVNQYMAFVRSGGGAGFHGLFNLESGVTQFSKFKDRTTGNAIDTKSSYDFTFGFGGGFGYGISQNTDFYISEQMDLVLHPQGDVTGVQSSSAPRVSVFRVGARVGF